MRKTIKMPRILKINWIKDLSISVVFNNGESRIIDFRKVLNKTNLVKNSPARILYNSEEFGKVELENNTLSWNNVEQYITMRNKEKMKVPFQIGADVLLKYSIHISKKKFFGGAMAHLRPHKALPLIIY